jgi:hypothetical protein
MCAESFAVNRIERLLQQRAEDRGLDLAPVLLRRLVEFPDLFTPKRKHFRFGEEIAVEA